MKLRFTVFRLSFFLSSLLLIIIGFLLALIITKTDAEQILQVLNKNWSGLQVVIENNDAYLFINGEFVDQTPFIDKKIKPGTYSIKIVPKDTSLYTHEFQLELRKGLLTVVAWQIGKDSIHSGGVIYQLEPINSQNGELSVITTPENAIIILDEQEQKIAPINFKDIAPGKHQITISLPSYVQHQHTINIEKKHRLKIFAQLAKVTNQEELKISEQSQSQKDSLTEIDHDGQTKNKLATILPTKFFHQQKEVVKVRKEPSTNSTILTYAEVNQSYLIEEQNYQWTKIKVASISGWVSNQYIR